MDTAIIDGTRIAYRIDGPEAAPPLVLIHCLGSNVEMWEPQIALLSRHFRLIRYDLRGHGRSEIGSGPATIERFGRDLLGLMDFLRIKNAAICGLSLGGLIAQWIAIHHP